MCMNSLAKTMYNFIRGALLGLVLFCAIPVMPAKAEQVITYFACKDKSAIEAVMDIAQSSVREAGMLLQEFSRVGICIVPGGPIVVDGEIGDKVVKDAEGDKLVIVTFKLPSGQELYSFTILDERNKS